MAAVERGVGPVSALHRAACQRAPVDARDGAREVERALHGPDLVMRLGREHLPDRRPRSSRSAARRRSGRELLTWQHGVDADLGTGAQARAGEAASARRDERLVADLGAVDVRVGPISARRAGCGPPAPRSGRTPNRMRQSAPDLDVAAAPGDSERDAREENGRRKPLALVLDRGLLVRGLAAARKRRRGSPDSRGLTGRPVAAGRHGQSSHARTRASHGLRGRGRLRGFRSKPADPPFAGSATNATPGARPGRHCGNAPGPGRQRAGRGSGGAALGREVVLRAGRGGAVLEGVCGRRAARGRRGRGPPVWTSLISGSRRAGRSARILVLLGLRSAAGRHGGVEIRLGGGRERRLEAVGGLAVGGRDGRERLAGASCVRSSAVVMPM